MKIFLFTTLLVFSTANYSQSGESIIYHTNGKISEKFATIAKNQVIMNGVTIDYNDFKRIEITDKNKNNKIVYEYVYLENKKRPFLMEVIFEGNKAKLYSRKAFIYRNENTNIGGTLNSEEYGHYGKKVDDKYVVEISLEGTNAIYGNKFKKKGVEFFSDCPELSTLIKSKKIKNKDKIKAFDYYEKECN